MFYIWQIFIFALIIGPLVFVHELGHFLFAKLFGVGVVRFAIGFGPALFKVRYGETIYQLGLIPLGGFVRMVGDMPDPITPAQATDQTLREGTSPTPVDPDEADPIIQAMMRDRTRWFLEQPLLKRSLIVFGGPLFNLLFAIFLVAICARIYGEEHAVTEPRIGSIMPGSPAEQGGLEEGDLVLSVNNKPATTWEALAQSIHKGPGGPVVLRIQRPTETLDLTVHPEQKEIRDLDGSRSSVYLIGIGPSTYRTPVGTLKSVFIGGLWSVNEIYRQYLGLWGMFKGYISPKDLAGPLFIFKVASKQAEKGFENLILFISILSVSLAVLNLLPIPVLDGGHLMFFFLEAIFGPISLRKKEFAQQVGVVLLLLLMVFALGNDISRNMDQVERGIQWKNSDEKSAPVTNDDSGN